MNNILKGTVVNPDTIYGKSAYEIAVANGFDGTEEEWLLHLERAQSEEVEEAAEQALTDIATNRQTALSDIANDTQAALSDIETAHTEVTTDAAQALTDIAEAKATMLEEIELAAEIVQTTGDSETAVMSQKATTEQIEDNSFKNIVVTKNLLNYAEYKEGHKIFKASWTNPDGSVTTEIQEQENSDYSYYKITLPAGTYAFTRTSAGILNLTTQEVIASGNTDDPFTLDAESEIAINSWHGYVVKLFSAEYTADEVEALGIYTLGENVLTPNIDKKISENTAEIARVEKAIEAAKQDIVTTKNLLAYAEYKAGHKYHHDDFNGIYELANSSYNYFKVKLPAGTYGFTSTAASIYNLTDNSVIASGNTDDPFTLEIESVVVINSWGSIVKKLYSTEYTADEVEALGIYTLGENILTPEIDARLTALENRMPDCEKYGLPVLKFTGDITEMTKDNAVTLAYEYGERSGTCTLKWQGTSSLAYPKKNYTVKFDNAFEAVEGWGEQNKYCLKANYIDFSHARNLVGAKLWGAMVQTRAGTPDKLLATANGGAVDGFPICVVINGKYVGLYTFNIPKDAWMFSMGDGANEGIVCAEAPEENDGAVCKFQSADIVLGRDYDVEYAPDEDNVEWMQNSLRTLIQTCIDTDGTNLAALETVLDVNSAIDYFIFSLLTFNYDGIKKNHLLATYDGTKWMFGAYDMDCLWGLHWRGDRFRENGIIYKTGHRAFEIVATYYKDALKARYKTLRSGALSEENFALVLTDFIGSIPKALLDEEVKIWTGLGLTSANNQSQMLEWYRRQVIKADAYINSL